MKPVKKLTVSAVLTALCVLLLLLGSVIRNIQISFVAAAGLLPAVAVIHCGYGWAAGVYAAAGILSLFILPDKSCTVWFLIVFGHYGILKSLIEKTKSRVLEWVLKILLFCACTAAIYFLFRSFFFGALPQYAEWILFAVLPVCYVLYDIAFTALIAFYDKRIRPHVE